MIFADSTYYASKGKELDEETGFWNNAESIDLPESVIRHNLCSFPWSLTIHDGGGL
jgi:hypothetical protein